MALHPWLNSATQMVYHLTVAMVRNGYVRGGSFVTEWSRAIELSCDKVTVSQGFPVVETFTFDDR